MRVTLLLGMLGFTSFLYAVDMSDYVPAFLKYNKNPSSPAITNPALAFKLPESSVRRVEQSKQLWYCNRVNNVFCTQPKLVEPNYPLIDELEPSDLIINPEKAPANSFYSKNSLGYSENAINSFNLTDSNQSSMQVYAPKLNELTPQDQIRNSLLLPIQASKNANINLSQQKIELNIHY